MPNLWTVTVERMITEAIPAAPEEVRAFYVDLDNITVFHPLVVSIQKLSCQKDFGSERTTYRVRDRIPVGRMSLPTSYWACVELTSRGEVRTEARQCPNVRLQGVVSFEAAERVTRLTERLRIIAPRPVAAFTQRAAVDAHIEMLRGIRDHFESR